MEWVEVTAKTIDEAKDQALDQLGVDENEAEFEVMEEPKAGLFGRLRSEARVRARIMPTAVRPKVDRAGRKRGRRDRTDDRPGAEDRPREPAGPRKPGGSSRLGGDGDGSGRSPRGAPSPQAERRPPTERAIRPTADRSEAMDAAGEGQGTATEVGEAFLRGLVSAFGVSASVIATELDDGDTIELAVDGDDVGTLIGSRGQTLAAIQELTRTVVQRKAEAGQPRVLVEVGGYRKARREALERFTRDVAAEVAASGVERVLEPMPPADRKVVHDTVNTIEGVSTASEGEEPRRRVVIVPGSSRG